MTNFHFIPKEVKEQILDRIKNEGTRVSDLAKEHGISDRTIYGWLKKTATFSVSLLEYSRLKKENKLLLELVGKLSLEQSKSFHFKKN